MKLKLFLIFLIFAAGIYIFFISSFEIKDFEQIIFKPNDISAAADKICAIEGNLFEIVDNTFWYYNNSGIINKNSTGETLEKIEIIEKITAAAVNENIIYYSTANELYELKKSGATRIKRLITALPKFALIQTLRIYNNHIFAADRGSYKVHCFTHTGELKWSSNGESKFILPGIEFSIDISPEGNLWAVNHGRKQLEQLDIETGKFIAVWKPIDSKVFPGCCNPAAIKMLANGRPLTLIKGGGNIISFAPDGSIEKIFIEKLSAYFLKLFVTVENDNNIYFDYNNNVYRINHE